MQWTPRVTVAAVIERNGRFLLVEEESGGRPVLNQPAGHLEDGEHLLAAVVREVAEETGMLFQPERLVGIYRWRLAPGDLTYLRFCFSGRVAEAVAQSALDPDILAKHWLEPEAIGTSAPPARSPLVLACIQDYLRGISYPLDLLQDFPDGP